MAITLVLHARNEVSTTSRSTLFSRIHKGIWKALLMLAMWVRLPSGELKYIIKIDILIIMKIVKESLGEVYSDIIDFFHKKEDISPFLKGQKVKLKKDISDLLPLYNKHAGKFTITEETWKNAYENLKEMLGEGPHVIYKIEEGSPQSGDWYLTFYDDKETSYHCNIFELVE